MIIGLNLNFMVLLDQPKKRTNFSVGSLYFDNAMYVLVMTVVSLLVDHHEVYSHL